VSTWLDAWRSRARRAPSAPVIELLVVAGADAGNVFTLEGDEILVGRGQPESGRTERVQLADRSISRRQAWIRRDESGTTIEHIDAAANPTMLNGRVVTRARLEAGDRIEMGRVAIDVRAREGMNLRGLTQIMEAAARESTRSPTTTEATDSPGAGATSALEGKDSPGAGAPTPLESTVSGVDDTTAAAGIAPGVAERTDVRPMAIRIGELTLLRGGGGGGGEAGAPRFPIFHGGTTIGRGEEAGVRLSEGGVSRLHAEIVVTGRGLVLRHRSATNPTLVNGFPVLDEVVLEDGDEIQLADRVVLGLRLDRGPRRARPSASLSGRMERKIDLDREIAAYNVMGSFLDVDVVASRAMKGPTEKAEHIIVSFERFRAWVGGICEEWNGQVLNSNGDELMCFFESAPSAVLAGSAILERLPAFNRDLNLLGREFRFRLGVHTGVSLVDLDAGIAYSEVLDTAGHIQKRAEPNTLVISQATLDSLPRPIPVTPIGELTADQTSAAPLLYRVDGYPPPADLAGSS